MLRIHPGVRVLCDFKAGLPSRGAWVRLTPHLFPDLTADGMSQGNLQGLMGVVRAGTNPERLIRRFELSELDSAAMVAVHALPNVKMVERRRSGSRVRRAAVHSDARPIAYLEAPLDLVARGEAIAPGSSEWLHAPLWGLAGRKLPRLEDLRAGLLLIKQRLGLCNPSPEELSPGLDSAERASLNNLNVPEQKARYRASLMPLAEHVTPDSISLLAGLVAETFTTEQAELHEIHCDMFACAMRSMLRQPLMDEIAAEFEYLVGARILAGTWDLPAFYHVSSLDAPFMPIRAYESLLSDAFGGFFSGSRVDKSER